MQLLATDRAMAAGLVLEVDLLPVDEGAERDEVAAFAKGIQSGQLREEDAGVVVSGEQRHHRLASRFTG
jgi:hypothetical protein